MRALPTCWAPVGEGARRPTGEGVVTAVPRSPPRGLRDRSEIALVMPLGAPIPPSPAASQALLAAFAERGIEWYPMLRSNKINPHPLQFGLYEDLVYHQGGGFRRTAGGRISWMPRQRSLEGTWRGRLVSRLPKRGRLGGIRRRLDPVRRYREDLAGQLAETNERVFELIRRDQEFYRQLIEPERGGELTEISAPAPAEGAEELSATR